jgi:hypothetical protein
MVYDPFYVSFLQELCLAIICPIYELSSNLKVTVEFDCFI